LHLNWQRVGIVASVLWAIVGIFLAEQILYSLTYGRFFTCTHTITDLSTCAQNLNKDLANAEIWRWVCMLSSRSPRSLSRGWLSMR
jgi:hypothetical protein